LETAEARTDVALDATIGERVEMSARMSLEQVFLLHTNSVVTFDDSRNHSQEVRS
jgi:hypothetical protein